MPLNRPNMGEEVKSTRNSNIRLKNIMKILSWVKQKKSKPIDPEEMKRIIKLLVKERNTERKLRTECEKKLSKNIKYQLDNIIKISKEEEERKLTAMQKEKKRQFNSTLKRLRLANRDITNVLSSSVTLTSTDTEGLTLKRKRKRKKRKKSKKVKKPNRVLRKSAKRKKRKKRRKSRKH